MNSLTLCSLCLILIAQSPWLTNARAHGLHGDGSDLIGQICDEIPEHKVECTNILRADIRILHANNFLELAKAVLDLATNKAIEGQNFLQGLVNTKYVPAIAECADHYGSLVEVFRSALSELEEDDPINANTDADSAGDEPNSCESALAAAHIVNPTISAFNHQTLLLSNIHT